MLYLPTLHTESSGFRLPLTEATAAKLIAALTETERERRETGLLFALRRDPAFTFWSISHVWLTANLAIQHLHALAAWLADQDLTRLLYPAWEAGSARASDALTLAEEASVRAAAAADWPSFHQLGCRGVTIANQVEARLAAATPRLDPNHDPQLLLGLLVDGHAWLAVAADPPTRVTSQRMTDWLAPELAESIRQFTPTCELPPENSTPVACDAAWGQEPHLAAAERTTSARQLIDSVLSQTRRLKQLESRFLEQVEQAKLQAMKEMAYGASHEINNPLANISTRAQTLLREEYDPERRRALANINRQAFRAHEMIADMMLFANPPRIERQATDLGKVVQEVLDELQVMADDRGVRMVQSDLGAGIVWVDPIQMAVAIKALCQNAVEAMPHGGTLEICSARVDNRLPMTVITVRDSGNGLSDEVRKHLFEPFFSGREAGRGLGFGLSKVWRIVTDHEGQIEVGGQPGAGTTLTLRLPAACDTPAGRER